MNAIRDSMNEVNKKFNSLPNHVTLLKNKEKSARVSEPSLGVLQSEEESDTQSEEEGGENSSKKDKDDNPSEEYGGATLLKKDGDDIPSEEDGGDIPSEKNKDGGSKDDNVLAIANQVQSEHGNSDDKMNDSAEMSAAAAQLESKMYEKGKTEKAKIEKKKKKRARIYDGKEVVPLKKTKGNNVRSPIGPRRQSREAAQKQKKEVYDGIAYT
ncbi:unnamed protein product [Eruca vesicaria subsp. sativa]|uniref:Uncharacterized protein n=1 Tax=Eruca vesicaria subsp. sativa TaxID=29727 RepID=A0ABC8KXQ7_ERUVS|nr:unnamed protein product [Eruca vesicaria subsp. sativa]